MKEMTPKERVMAFFRHEPVDELPTDEGIFVLFNPEAYKERPSHEHGGVDWFGVPWKYESSVDAIAPDHSVEPIMEDICDWRELVKFPDLDAWEEVEEFFNTYMEWKIKLMEKVIEYYKPDVLMFHDDWGTQNNMFFSPDVWRSLIKPQIKKAVDRCHELGVLFDMHSCGKIEAVVPEFVELGIDAWQGMEINDIPKLKSITGMNLGYHTTPDYQGYQTEALAGTLTEEDLRRRVREVFEKTAEGYCYCPMFLPFGGWSTEVMIDEIMKCGKTIYKDA